MPNPSRESTGRLRQRITPAELFAVSCDACGCTDPECGLVLSSVCHPRAGTRVKFFKATRALQIVCAQCDALVTTIVLEPSS